MPRVARPKGFDYAAQIRERSANRPQLLDLKAMVGGSDEERKPYKCSEGVAIINISGLLTGSAEWWDETEYGEIQNEVAQALNDPAVQGILLRVNSFGGYTDGAFECAAFLAEAGRKKKMWAVADSVAYSAAYLLASQAERLYIPPVTGGVGSIGVYMAHVEYSKALADDGIGVTLISAGEGKTDGNPFEPLSAEAKERFTAEVDRLYGEFVAAVSRGRGIGPDEVRKAGALTYSSGAAISAKLADAYGSMAEAWAALALANQQVSISMAASAAMTSTKESRMLDTTKADAATSATATADQLSAARKAGLADAAEIVQLCALAGKPSMAAKFLDENKSAAEVRTELLNAKAAEQSEEIDGRAKGTGMTAQQASHADSNGLLAACEQLAAGMKKGVN